MDARKLNDKKTNPAINEGLLQPISIGVITIEDRSEAFLKLLRYLIISLSNYPSHCELVICNNSPSNHLEKIKEIVAQSNIENACDVVIKQSQSNNIAVGRNVLFEESSHNWLAFIDDDEYPSEYWLIELARSMIHLDANIVAGPVAINFPKETPYWLNNADLHNINKKNEGDNVPYTNTGNILIRKDSIPEPHFDADFGKSGGSDTEFFLRNQALGMVMKWSSKSLVFEDVEPARANTQFMIRRFMNQGSNYRRIMSLHGKINNQWAFTLRSILTILISAPIAAVLLLIKHKAAGHWLKRVLANTGMLIKPRRKLYE